MFTVFRKTNLPLNALLLKVFLEGDFFLKEFMDKITLSLEWIWSSSFNVFSYKVHDFNFFKSFINNLARVSSGKGEFNSLRVYHSLEMSLVNLRSINIYCYFITIKIEWIINKKEECS